MSVQLIFTGKASPEQVKACERIANTVGEAIGVFMNNDATAKDRADASLAICHGLLVLDVMSNGSDLAWMKALRARLVLVIESVDMAIEAAAEAGGAPAPGVH